MILYTLIFVAVVLTVTMFATRQAMLGWPCVIFWAIAGAHSFTLATAPWVDIYFYLFLACSLGMTIFCMMAQFGLKEKKDRTDKEEYIDEQGGKAIDDTGKTPDIENINDDFNDIPGESNEEKESRRVKALHGRAKERRER